MLNLHLKVSSSNLRTWIRRRPNQIR